MRNPGSHGVGAEAGTRAGAASAPRSSTTATGRCASTSARQRPAHPAHGRCAGPGSWAQALTRARSGSGRPVGSSPQPGRVASRTA